MFSTMYVFMYLQKLLLTERFITHITGVPMLSTVYALMITGVTE